MEYDNTHITVRTDGDLLDQVLMNYLSNAIRYTPEGKHIEISAARTGNSVRLSVFNEGEGLPEGGAAENLGEILPHRPRPHPRPAAPASVCRLSAPSRIPCTAPAVRRTSKAVSASGLNCRICCLQRTAR